ncbi:MAG TPA: NAD(P)(+) transhydrogenase (Re/Si-specific) subunit beta [Nitrospiria bacterium]
MSESVFSLAYLIASVLFISGLKGLSSPATARKGNISGIIGMIIAIGATILDPKIESYTLLIVGILIGATIGTALALKIQMTSMPELVALLHSFVGLAAVLVAAAVFYDHQEMGTSIPLDMLAEMFIGAFIGAITFTGSLVAFAKLRGLVGGQPTVFKGQHLINLLLGMIMIGFGIYFSLSQDPTPFLILTAIAFALGVLLIIPIGGADMPVVVSMLNSYSGWSAAATGFILSNNLLIITGALVGSSGAILSYIMCKAMNRSILNVLFGGFGTGDQATAAVSLAAQAAQKGVKSGSPEDVAYILSAAKSIIIVPGYGMAVAHAQHAVRELFDLLEARGIKVTFGIHPVAGRMPGHMNVLLAEANVPYNRVFEMEDINSSFSSTDVSFVIGANDIVNPGALTDKDSPIYGMPILEVNRSKTVMVLKRSMNTGFAGIDNKLFYEDNTMMVFGSAKETVEEIVGALKNL